MGLPIRHSIDNGRYCPILPDSAAKPHDLKAKRPDFGPKPRDSETNSHDAGTILRDKFSDSAVPKATFRHNIVPESCDSASLDGRTIVRHYGLDC